MKIAQCISILILTVFIVLSCSTSPSHTFTKEIDENNIEICTNSGEPKFTESLYTIEESLSLGGEEPEPKLFQPYGVLVDDEGSLFFVDEGRIKKFSSKGEFISFISQPGQGPGEVTHPKLEAIIGDTLYVAQSMWSGRRKYELYHTDGRHIERVMHPKLKIEKKPGGRKYTVGPIGSFKFLFYTQVPIETGNKSVDELKGSATYMVFSTEGEYLADQTFPCDIEVIKNDMAYGFTKNENDVRIFKRFMLIKNE